MALTLNLVADPDAVLYNRRVKINPLNGEVIEDVCASRPIFNPSGAVRLEGKAAKGEGTVGEGLEDDSEQLPAVGSSRAALRARKQLFELSVCNDLDMFFTLTLSPEKIDRYDYKEAVRRLSQWLDNRVRRRGLRYVAVPELHKDGAVHFHGLCNSAAMRLVDSGKTDKGHTIYNVSDWKIGFTTAVRLYGERTAAAHYIAKYVTKSTTCGTIGGRYYFHGGALDKARCVYYHEDWNGFAGKKVDIESAGLSFKYAK